MPRPSGGARGDKGRRAADRGRENGARAGALEPVRPDDADASSMDLEPADDDDEEQHREREMEALAAAAAADAAQGRPAHAGRRGQRAPGGPITVGGSAHQIDTRLHRACASHILPLCGCLCVYGVCVSVCLCLCL